MVTSNKTAPNISAATSKAAETRPDTTKPAPKSKELSSNITSEPIEVTNENYEELYEKALNGIGYITTSQTGDVVEKLYYPLEVEGEGDQA